MSFTKRFAGHCLLNVCDFVPQTKPWLSRWGMRTRKEWFGDRVVRVQTPTGGTFKVGSLGRNHLSFELFWKGTGYYEPITTLVAQELLGPGDTFLDVGANIGFYSLVLSTQRPEIRVVAFEPNPRNFAMLEHNVHVSGLHNVRCEPVAMSDRDGTATLFLAASDMSASLRDDFEDEKTGSTVVETVTLDSYVRKNPVKGHVLIKVDVEGHEVAFFRGAADTIEVFSPDIITEVTLDYDRELIEFFKRLGYNFYQITDRGLIPAASMGPVVRDRFVFLNYLVSRKTPAEAGALFGRIAPQVRAIDLTRTSKYLTRDAIAKFVARSAAASTKQVQQPVA